MLHSGVFVGRQYATFAGITRGQKVYDFIEKLLVRRFVTPIELGSTGRTRIFHVQHKPLYAAIGEPDNRNRRRVTIDRAIERLMVLDGVIADRSVTWLGSEREKRRHFKNRLGDRLRDNEYPRLVFGRKPNVTVRYFPDKLPIGHDRDHYRHVFIYLARSASPMDFRVFILRHLELLNALAFWTIRALFPPSLAAAMNAYRNAASELVTKPLSLSQAEELTWFLRQPQMPEQDTSAAGRARLQAARKAFRSPRFAAIRRHWLAEGSRAVFLAASPVARDTMERHRANIECVELPHNYEHLFALARWGARRRGANRGDEALGMSGPQCDRNCVMNACSSRASTANGAKASATVSAVWYPSDRDAIARLYAGWASLIQMVLSTSRPNPESAGRDSNWTSRPYRAGRRRPPTMSSVPADAAICT